MTEELQAAAKAVASTLRKNEKAYETMLSKNARPWQLQTVADAIAHHRTMLDLIEGRPVDAEARKAAMEAIPGYIRKIENILPKFQPGTPQHTLATRRIAAYRLAADLGSAGGQ